MGGEEREEGRKERDRRGKGREGGAQRERGNEERGERGERTSSWSGVGASEPRDSACRARLSVACMHQRCRK